MGLVKIFTKYYNHYYKHEKKEVKETLDWIKKEMPIYLTNADNIKKILSVERRTMATFL